LEYIFINTHSFFPQKRISPEKVEKILPFSLEKTFEAFKKRHLRYKKEMSLNDFFTAILAGGSERNLFFMWPALDRIPIQYINEFSGKGNIQYKNVFIFPEPSVIDSQYIPLEKIFYLKGHITVYKTDATRTTALPIEFQVTDFGFLPHSLTRYCQISRKATIVYKQPSIDLEGGVAKYEINPSNINYNSEQPNIFKNTDFFSELSEKNGVIGPVTYPMVMANIALWDKLFAFQQNLLTKLAANEIKVKNNNVVVAYIATTTAVKKSLSASSILSYQLDKNQTLNEKRLLLKENPNIVGLFTKEVRLLHLSCKLKKSEFKNQSEYLSQLETTKFIIDKCSSDDLDMLLVKNHSGFLDDSGSFNYDNYIKFMYNVADSKQFLRLENILVCTTNEIDISNDRNKASALQIIDSRRNLELAEIENDNDITVFAKGRSINEIKAIQREEKARRKDEVINRYNRLISEIKNQTFSQEEIDFNLYFSISSDSIDDFNNFLSNARTLKLIVDVQLAFSKNQRFQKSFKRLKNGDVNNPLLARMLFDAGNLLPIDRPAPSFKFHNENLNIEQKEAIGKTYASESICAIQGPPGTGKTTVIAEIVEQFADRSQRVLVSSENKRAIDNVARKIEQNILSSSLNSNVVFISKVDQDLKKRHLRNLISGVTDVEKNIIARSMAIINETVGQYEKAENLFSQMKKTMFDLEAEYAQTSANGIRRDSVLEEIREQQRHVVPLDDNIANLRANAFVIRIELDRLLQEMKNLEGYFFECLADDDDDNNQFLRQTFDDLMSLQHLRMITRQRLDRYLMADREILANDIAKIISMKQSLLMCLEKTLLFERMNETGLSGAELEKAQNSYMKFCDEHPDVDIQNDFELPLIDLLHPKALKEILQSADPEQTFFERDSEFRMMMSRHIEELDAKIAPLQIALKENVEATERLQNERSDAVGTIQALGGESVIIDQPVQKANLMTKLTDVIETASINFEGDSLEEMMTSVRSFWLEWQMDNSARIKNYDRIRWLRQIQEHGRHRSIQHSGVKNIAETAANVIGLTTSAAQSIKSKDHDIEIFVKNWSPDVHIVDEVSKTSLGELVNLLIDSKQIVLVGDHRQLQPKYEFDRLEDSRIAIMAVPDFTTGDNEKYSLIYQKSLFQMFYQRATDHYRSFLVRQHRFHEDIQRLVNNFYADQPLMLGDPNHQNGRCEHHLTLMGTSRPLIEPRHHIVFVNCPDFEAKDRGNIYNPQEAKVVNALVRQIVPLIMKLEEKLSLGILSAYGRQQSEFNLQKSDAIRVLKRSYDEKTRLEPPIISTIDDSQGQERDIVIVSMVRNPRVPSKCDPSFIQSYQRINVALSRARRLLIVVGSEKFLSGIRINIPSHIGDSSRDRENVAIYADIIETIKGVGAFIQADDILNGAEDDQ